MPSVNDRTNYFPGLAHRHCIAYSMFIVDFINFILNPINRQKYNITTENIYNDSQSIKINSEETCIRLLLDNGKTRVGNFDSYNTHCYEFYVNPDVFTIDGDLFEEFEYVDYSEEYFFQISLLYKNQHVFYIMLFNYLKKHMNTSFSIHDAPDPVEYLERYSELLDTAMEKGYYNDIIDLMSFVRWDGYKNHVECKQRFSFL